MRTWAGWVAIMVAAVAAPGSADAYFLDKGRDFDVRLRTYTQAAIVVQDTNEQPPVINSGNVISHRNFYNPEFDAKLTDYMGWSHTTPGFSLIAPDDLKFRFAWWGFYDGIFDYLNPRWRAQLNNAPAARLAQSDNIRGESYTFSDQRKKLRPILGHRNRINELYLDYTKGRVFFRVGRQAIAWGESDSIVFQDVINNFDLTQGAPGLFEDLDEARIPFYAVRSTVKLVDSWRWLSSAFADMYFVPGPVDTTVPITPSWFGLPYSPPGQSDPQKTQVPPGIPLHVSLVDRLPKNDWDQSRWGVRLTSVLFRDYTVQTWFFRAFPTQPTPLLLPGTLGRTDIPPTLIDDRGFRTPICRDANGQQIPHEIGATGVTADGRPCGYQTPIVSALYRRLTSVFGLAATWFSQPLNGIIRTEFQYFLGEDSFIPNVNQDPRAQVVTNGVVNRIPKADYLRYTIGFDRFFFMRFLNPTNSFTFSGAFNGQWNVTATVDHLDFRNPQVKPGKLVATPTGQPVPNSNWEDQYEHELFFAGALQTDYLHGKLTPRITMILDVSGMYAFVPTATYRITDNFLLSGTLIAIEGSRRTGPATFRDRDQVQLRLTYQLN